MLPPTTLDADFIKRFESAETDFYRAIADDHRSTSLFATHFQSLHRLLEQSRNSLCTKTLELISGISSRISIVAKGILSIEKEAENLESELSEELATAMQDLSLEDRPPKQPPQVDCTTSTQSQPTKQTTKRTRNKGPSKSTSATPSISMLCLDGVSPRQWLLNHLHNPYPSKRAKTDAAAEVGIPVKSVDEWFTYARKKIGWTTIRKRYFQGKSCLAIDCASRVFLGEGDEPQISDCLRQSFMKMKELAESLYGGEFGESELARKVEGLIESQRELTRQDKMGKRKCLSQPQLERATCPTKPLDLEKGVHRSSRKRMLPDEDDQIPSPGEGLSPKRARRSLPTRLPSIISCTSNTSESGASSPCPSTSSSILDTLVVDPVMEGVTSINRSGIRGQSTMSGMCSQPISGPSSIDELDSSAMYKSISTLTTDPDSQNRKRPRGSKVSPTSGKPETGRQRTRTRAEASVEPQYKTESPVVSSFLTDSAKEQLDRSNRKRSLSEEDETYDLYRVGKCPRRSLPNRPTSMLSCTSSDTYESGASTPSPPTPSSTTSQLTLERDTLPQPNLFFPGSNGPLVHTNFFTDASMYGPIPNSGLFDPFGPIGLNLTQECDDAFSVFDVPSDSLQEILSGLDFSFPTGTDIGEDVLGEFEFTAANLNLNLLPGAEFCPLASAHPLS